MGGKGGKQGPALDSYSRYASPIYLSVGLWNRGKAMAAVMEATGTARPTFDKGNIADIFAYIRSFGRGVERIYARPGSPSNGEKLFVAKRCAECHSVTAQGDPSRANLRARLIKGSLMTIAGAMWNHGPKMWADMARRGIAASSLGVEEMSDVIGYLYFLQFIDPAGVPERGRLVFQEKRCSQCHSAQAKGAVQGPIFASSEKLKTQLEVVTEMWNHASTMEETMLKQSLEWPVFRGGEMADLVAYLVSLRAEK